MAVLIFPLIAFLFISMTLQSPSFWVLGGVFVSGMVTALLLKQWLPDISYFLRNWLLDCSCGTERIFQSREGNVKDSPIFYDSCRVLPEDIDRNGHMSNDKYLFHLNFARKHYFCRLGVWQYLWRRNWNMVVSSQSIRYRREMHLWQRYRICVQVVGWSDSEKCIYLESTFMGAEDAVDASFVYAVHWTKYRLLNGLRSTQGDDSTESPLPSIVLGGCCSSLRNLLEDEGAEDLRLWRKANSISSTKLRQRAGAKVTEHNKNTKLS